MAEFLLSHGANVSTVADEGSTALHMAARYGRLGPSNFLIAHGADTDARNHADQTVLHYASAYSPVVNYWGEELWEVNCLSEHLSQDLLDKRADVNAADDRGITPLHGLLRWHFHCKVSRDRNVLLKAGADLDAKAHGDDHTIRSYIGQSESWRSDEAGLLEAVLVKPAHARS